MKNTNKLLAIILAIFMMAVIAPMAFAAEDTVTIDLANGNVTISATGYSINGAAETPFTGDYIITGKNDETKMANVIQINSVADGTDITLKDVDITQKGSPCVMLNTDITLNATGTVKLTNTSPTISANGKNVVITGDADILVNTGVYLATVGTMDITCNSLKVICTGSAPIVYGCTDFKVNAVKDVVLNGWFTSGNVEITAGEDITIGNANSTAPLLSGAATLKSTNGNIVIDHKVMICTGSAFTAEAAGDVRVSAGSTSPAITVTTTIKGVNVKLSNASGAIISGSKLDIDATGDIDIDGNSSGAPLITATETKLEGNNITLSNASGTIVNCSKLDIDATGDIDIDGNSSGAPLITATETNLEGNNITIANDGITMLVCCDDLTVNATGEFTAVGASRAPLIAGKSASIYFDITAGSVEIENTQTNSMVISGGGNITATDGDVSVKGNLNNPGLASENLAVTAENGTVTLQNDGSGFVVAAMLTVDAQSIVLANPNATAPIAPDGYDLTAENDITVITGNATPSNDPTGSDAKYDFGGKLTVTTSAGTTEHTHEFVDVEYNNDATCEADGTKLVKCDCDWAKEKTVTAEGTKLDHVDNDGDYLCDNACGHEFEKPADETCPDCGRPVHGDTLVDNFICWFVMLINLIKTMF